jgi:hypothetical protein
MATYVNDLRLTELATGEGSGTWGVTTNTNLELIGEALGYGTQDCFATDADATTTVADGATDPARAMYFKVTSSATLTATRTLTIGPNTVSRVMLIENATTGSQSIAISQGSGGNVTIASGQVKMVYLDGAGSGAAVVDALADLELGTITVANLTATTADINGGTADGVVIGGSTPAAITGTTVTANTSLTVNATTTITDILDEDNMASDSATALATQQSIKAYVDSQVGTVDTLAEILANGNTTGGTDIAVGTGDDITFADSSKAIFGAGSDLSIYHDGSNSYISEAGTGNLIIGAGAGVLIKNKDLDENLLSAYQNGAVELFYDNAEKLATTATGIDVTGTVTADGLTIDGGNTLRLDAASTTDFFTIIQGGTQAVLTADSPDGAGNMLFKTAAAGVDTDRMQIASNGDISFYEDTGTTAKFFWDASAESLGIGTTTTTSTLNIQAGNPTIRFYDSNLSTRQMEISAENGHAIFKIDPNQTQVTSYFAVEIDTTERMRIDSSGYVGMGTDAPLTPLHIKSTSAGEVLRIESTEEGAVDGPTLGLFRNSASPADGDGLGAINFYGEDSVGNITTYAQIRVEASDVTNGTEDGLMSIRTIINGTDTARLNLKSEEAVFNESGIDTDFRVESDTNEYALFVDAGNSRVGINNSSPDRPVHLKDAGNRNYIKAETTGTTDSEEAGFDVKAGSNNYLVGALGGTDNRFFIYDLANALDKFTIKQGDIIINDSGVDGDFRVESDTNTHALFVDAGNSSVGINTSAPTFGTGNGLEIYNSESGIGVGGATLRLTRGDVSSEVDDPIGTIEFYSKDADGAHISAFIQSTAQELFGRQGDLIFGTAQGISVDAVEATRISSAGSLIHQKAAVFNESGGDNDFRVESDSNTHALFVDAGNNVVGVGTQQTLDPWTSYSPLAVGDQLMIGSTGASSTFTNMVHGGYYDGTNWLQRYTDVTVARHEMIGGSSGSYHNFYTATNVTADTATTQILNLSFTPTTAVFNEDSRDIDFRVESDTNTHALFVDAGNSRVGINNSSPATDLDVTGSMNVTQAGGAYAATFTTAFDYVAKFVSSDSAAFIVLQDNNSTDNYNRIGAVGNSIQIESGNVENAIFTSTSSVFNENSVDMDFRVESDNNANMLFVDAGEDEVIVGGTANQSNAVLSINTTASKHGKSIESVSSITGGAEKAVMAEGVVAVDTTSLGTVLSIPILSQGSRWRRFIIQFIFSSGEYALNSNATSGTAIISFASLTSLTTVSLQDSTGNVASVGSSGTDLQITFTNGFINGNSNWEGVLVYYKILGSEPNFVQIWNASLN